MPWINLNVIKLKQNNDKWRFQLVVRNMINLQLKIINVEINVKSVLLIYSLEKNISISLLVWFHLLRYEIFLKMIIFLVQR